MIFSHDAASSRIVTPVSSMQPTTETIDGSHRSHESLKMSSASRNARMLAIDSRASPPSGPSHSPSPHVAATQLETAETTRPYTA